MGDINLKINGLNVTAPEGSTILEAARHAGIRIPTLCFLKDLNEIGACRMCVVEVKGARNLVAACVHPAAEGMEVFTNTPKLITSRKRTLQLLLSNHDKQCLSCVRSGSCELQELCQEYGVDDEHFYGGTMTTYEKDYSAPHMVRDNNKCILCRRCEAVCFKSQAVGVIGANNRGFDTAIGCAFDMGLGETACVSCGQCIAVCPTGALYEKDSTQEIIDAIADPDKYVIVQTAPSVRAGLGEEFGYPMGTDVEGKMAAALRRIGFDRVFDTDWAADLTIMEEATELLQRVKGGGVLPMITSCSPGWVKFCEHFYPDLIDHLSTCKSPQQMFGAMVKTYFAEKEGIDPKKIVSVSVMPCTAKKFEIGRPDEEAAGIPDVDIAITTRELARLIRRCGVDFVSLPDETFDNPMGESTGGGVIFGATGGVMEAALRMAVEAISGQELPSVDFKEVRGTKGVKEASYTVGDLTVNVAVASGLSNAKILLDKIRSGEANYHFIEIMCCPGGCVNGGGQPRVTADVRNFSDMRAIRASVLYKNDEKKTYRKSQDNPAIKQLYEEFLGEPGGHKAHETLHTSYVKRTIN
jgi:NADP-reducing hydrogenase subunit HndD